MDPKTLGLSKRETETVTANVIELDEKPLNEGDSCLTAAEKWQPGFWNQFPWLGVGCLVSAIVMSIVAIVVLLTSHEKAASQWDKRIAPNVILSILNSAASVCIAIAVAQGVAIAWWRKAMHGATITELSNTWSFGSSLSSIFLNLKYFNLAALAALVTKLTIVDGVLFQRATTTYVALGPHHPRNISTFPAKWLPVTGRTNEFGNDTDILLDAFTYDVAAWISSAYGSIYSTYGFGDCEGICALNVSAPGYIVSCTNYTEHVDIIGDAEAYANPNITRTTATTDIFNVDFSLNWATAEKNYTWIGVNTTSYQALERNENNATERCPATLLKQECEFRQAMMTYPVYLEFTNVTTKKKHESLSRVNVYMGTINETTGTYQELEYFDPAIGQLPGFKFEHWINFTNNLSGSYRETTNGGIYRALENQYKSRTWVTTESNDSNWAVSTESQFAQMLQDSWETPDYGNDSCPYTIVDPLQTIIVGLNALAFITADDLYNRPNYTDYYMSDDELSAYYNNSLQYVQATEMKSEVHYSTNTAYMCGALASTLVCVLLIIPVYWGFWELGRKVSLNPIEIANAFQAPVLSSVHPGSGHADDVVKVAGKQHVQYAHAVDPETGRTYKIVAR